MTKKDFLELLRVKLKNLPKDDIEERVNFYSEMIDDRIEDGYSEEDAVKEIGNVDEISREIISKTPLKTLIKEKTDVIKKKYPELLQKNDESFTKKVDIYQNTNNENLVSTQEDIFTKKPNIYQNTNVTKNENLVKENVCKNTSVEGETGEESDWKDKFSF